MNPIDIKATWHKESYDQFLNALLPQLLADRLPLADYRVMSTDTYMCQITVSVAAADGNIATAVYNDLPQPDEQGLFVVQESKFTVVPYASSENLDTATIVCVGEMLHTMLQERLGAAPPDLPWDENLLRSWLPLDSWLTERFVGTDGGHVYERHFQQLDRTNWLSQRSHLRRLYMELSDPNRVITPGQLGRLCPYEKPEGPNLGRIGSIAVGAAIAYGKLVIENDAPEAGLGLSMSAIPLVEHTDANRLLMGANMMRQWLPYDQPESALVQSGNEPPATEFWAGRNMLTAFIPWGEDVGEDAIILSESAAARMSNAGTKNPDYASLNHQIEPGDKLSNRFGMKGVVSRILPDDQMPKMSDGTPVELLFSSVGIHSRLTMGQLREAVLGRLAHAEGEPIIAPPFHGPSEAEIRQRLEGLGLPSDGSEQLLHGETGEPLPNRSTAGWVYWGRTHHRVIDKLAVTAEDHNGAQRHSELEFQMLYQIGAKALIREHFQQRATAPKSANAEASEAGSTSQTLRFRSLQYRLAAAGIGVTHHEDGLHFELLQPTPDGIRLARPVPHPWLGEHHIESLRSIASAPDALFPYGLPSRVRERQLSGVAGSQTFPEFDAVVRANEKLDRLQKSNAPTSLTDPAFAQLENAIHTYFDDLLTPDDLRFDARISFSGRSVLAPGAGLTYEQMGLPDDMAWTLFGPQVAQKLNNEAVVNRTGAAAAVLDEIMADSWMLVHHISWARPTAITAFRPVRHSDKVIRIPFVACEPMDADFDGDQAAVYLPQTEAGQREAGELISLAGHLTRNPALLHEITPHRDPMWGLATLSLTKAGQTTIQEIVGAEIDVRPGFVTRTALVDALTPQIHTRGANHVLAAVDALMQLGFDTLKETGFSLNPFVKLDQELPAAPPVDRPDLWDVYMQQRAEQLLATEAYEGDWERYVLASKAGALTVNRIRLLAMLLVARGVVTDIDGKSIAIPQNFVDGLPPEEHFKTVAGAQAGMRRVVEEWTRNAETSPAAGQVHSVYTLARARRAAHPGVVFARAAAMNEVDPLVDEESRFFVGV